MDHTDATTTVPGPDLAHVWTIEMDQQVSAPAVMSAVLSKSEVTRWRRWLDPVRRHRYLVAHAATRMILGRYLATAPAQLDIRTGQWGRPELAGRPLRFNLTHSGKLALLAVAATRDIGVDIEQVDGRPVEALAARYFTPAESALVAAARPTIRREVYLRLWTRKEACVKAAGGRLVDGLHLEVGTAGPVRLVTDPAGRLRGPWLVHDLPTPPGFAAALALAGTRPFQVVRARWSGVDAGWLG